MPTGNCSRPDDTNWTGAEIKSYCRLASLLDVPLVQAAQNVVPVAVTAGDKIEGLRQWASGRCLSADRAGVYSRSDGGSGGRVRRGTPRGPISQPNRSQPPCHSASIRDFRPLIPAHGGRRLPGRLCT
jgi:hypothetical protein